jgi:hypothetical protein
MKIYGLLLAFAFSAAVQAETGYVFEGDLNDDGVLDSIMSGPSELFGNGGGPFIVSLSNGSGGFNRKEIGLHPKAAALDLVKGHPRIWGFWHLSCCEGTLSITTLDEKFETQTIQLYFSGDQGYPTVSQNIYNAIFEGKSLIKFKTVENYQVPTPLRGEWGK